MPCVEVVYRLCRERHCPSLEKRRKDRCWRLTSVSHSKKVIDHGQLDTHFVPTRQKMISGDITHHND